MTASPIGEDAFDAYFRAFGPRVKAVACRLVDADEADDVTQEVMLQAYHRYVERREIPAWPWVATVTRNIAVDHYRRVRRMLPTVDASIEALTSPLDDDPSTAAVHADARRHLAAALEALSPVDRAVVTRHDIDGVAISAMAAAFGMSANALRQRLFRAHRFLARRYRSLGGQQLAIQPGLTVAALREHLAARLQPLGFRVAPVQACTRQRGCAAAVVGAVIAVGPVLPSWLRPPAPPAVPHAGAAIPGATEPVLGALDGGVAADGWFVAHLMRPEFFERLDRLTGAAPDTGDWPTRPTTDPPPAGCTDRERGVRTESTPTAPPDQVDSRCPLSAAVRAGLPGQPGTSGRTPDSPDRDEHVAPPAHVGFDVPGPPVVVRARLATGGTSATTT